jgi:O-antigen/teichoic acid export membrane protein
MVALIHALRSFGVGQFVIQEKHLDESLIRTVFTIYLIIGWLLAGVVFAISGPAGAFYGDVGVSHVLKVLSLVFVLLPFGGITQSRLRRDFEFGKLIKIQIAETITRSCATVALAYAGFSYMSMAWASVMASSVMIIGCAVWGWQYRVRGLNLAGWRRVLHFGTHRTVASIVSQVGAQSANLIIGRMLGLAATGLYSRGFGVVNMYRSKVVGAINAVAFPAFARDHRETNTAPQLFLKSLVHLTGISWPFFAAGILLARPLIDVLFGEQWDAAVPLMRWLCASAVVGTLTWQCTQFLVAVGRAGTVTRIVLQYQPIHVGLTIIAALFSLEAVAAVQVLVHTIKAVLFYAKLHEYDALRIRKCARALVPSALVSLATCIAPAIVVAWPGFVSQHMLLALVVGIAGGGAGWLAVVVVVKHPILADILRVVDVLRGNVMPAVNGFRARWLHDSK